ncbi:hypothetical protein [Persephonella sp.]
MRTIDIQDLLRRYRIDVEFIGDFLDNDPVEIQEAFYKRDEILQEFDRLTWKELKEFLSIEKELEKILPEIRRKYPEFYQKIIYPQNEIIKTKLIDILVSK